MTATILLLLGGGLGALSRFLLHDVSGKHHAWMIFAINLLGSFLLAYVSQLSLSLSWQMFLCRGFLSSFTTFSTLVALTYQLQMQNRLLGLGYLIATITGSLFMFHLGS